MACVVLTDGVDSADPEGSLGILVQGVDPVVGERRCISQDFAIPADAPCLQVHSIQAEGLRTYP